MSFTRVLWGVGAACAALSSGCSEAVSVASEGAYQAQFYATNGGAKAKCNIAGHNRGVGYVSATEVRRPLIKDTVGGAKIQCAVKAEGGGVAAVGIIEDKSANHIDFEIKAITSGATDMQPATGRLGYRSDVTAVIYNSTSAKPCKFFFSPQQAKELAPGRIWVQYLCPEIESEGFGCEVNGTLAMENCEQ
jgi:hypothetical protein